jgi:acyl-CoA thioester hydrolase
MKDPEHVFNFRVPLSYIDTGGVIYNGNYLDIYNQARDEYLRDAGFPYKKLNEQAKYHLSVIEVNIKYKAPVFYDELIEIITTIEKIGTKSLIFNQAIYKDKRNQLCNTARSVIVCTKARKAEPLPTEFVAAMKEYQAQV